ncbi:MAG: carboxypeptidase regulatory-like domain-containing protein [Spirochaetales bacterium]|nr:carboxypeptidase regulatory-like domain-containing protein [Spirochaetales bacterium]
MKNICMVMLKTAVICGILASCATKLPPPTEFDKAPLLGMIYDADGAPVHNAGISVNGGENLISDINGRFIFNELARGDHRISAVKDGYEPAETVFSFLNKSQILYLCLYNAPQLLKKAKEYTELKNYQKADEFLDRTLLLDDEYAPALYLKAVISAKTEDYGQCAALLDRLAVLGYKGEEILALQSLCESMEE